MAPIKSLKMSSKETNKFMNAHGAIVGLICCAIVVAFVYWCLEVNHQNSNDTVSAAGLTEFAKAINARQTAFEGAVVGFLMIFVIVYIKNQYFPYRM